MRLIKVTGGLGNQMFIYAFYLRMKKYYPKVRIDLSDMMHYKVHYGYEMHRVFNLPHTEFCINQPLKKVIEFLFFKKIYERKQAPNSLRAFEKKYFWPLLYFKGFYQSERFFADIKDEVRESLSLLTRIKPTVEVLICLKFWTRMKTQYLYIFVVEIICNPSIGLLPGVYASYLTIKTQ